MHSVLVSDVAFDGPDKWGSDGPVEVNVELHGIVARLDLANAVLELTELPMLRKGPTATVRVDLRLVSVSTFPDVDIHDIVQIRGLWLRRGFVQAVSLAKPREPRAFSDPAFLQMFVERAQLALHLARTLPRP